jgi:Zn ribbon nucleic-acid-binding protein
MSSSNCELCEAARLTTWWYEDDVCWVAECESCGVPMVVWREHRADPPPDTRAAMLARLRAVADEHGPRSYWIDDTLRTIPDHYHAHARRRPFA